MKQWQTFWIEDKDNLPERPACYAVLQHCFVVYVGQTDNLRGRMTKWYEQGNVIYCHGKREVSLSGFVEFKYRLPKKRGEEAMIEKRLIDRLRPRYNVGAGRPKRRH